MLPSRFVVVSFPAISNSVLKPMISHSDRPTPSTSAFATALKRSFEGLALRSGIRSRKNCAISVSSACRAAGEAPASVPVSASDHRLKSALRASGMPIIREITVTGSGVVSPSTMSTSPRIGSAPTRSLAIRSMSGSMLFSIAVVNALLTIERNCVCRGGSSVSVGNGTASPIAADENR